MPAAFGTRFEAETPSLIVLDEHYSWRLIPKPQRDAKDFARVVKNKGTLYLHGWRMGFNSPVVRDAFSEFTELLEGEGITLPGPDPKFKGVENLFEGILVDPLIVLNPPPAPEEGTPLLLLNDTNEFFERQKRGSRIVYSGVVEKSWLRNGFLSRGLELEIDLLRPDTYRIDYAHFTPDKEHVVGVYRWDEAISLGKGDRSGSDWYPQMFRVEHEVVDTIAQQASEIAVPQINSGLDYGDSWKRLIKGEPRRIAEIVSRTSNKIV